LQIYLVDMAVQALNESIIEHESELAEVTRLGSELRQLSVGDDAAQLDCELESISSRYTALRSMSSQRLSQMGQVPVILERFYASHQAVINWVSQLESDLQQRDIQPGPEAELHLQVSLVSL